jgi:hypothetical protein
VSNLACNSQPSAADAGIDSGLPVDSGTESGVDGGLPLGDGGSQTGPATLEIPLPAHTVAAESDSYFCLHTTLDAGRVAGIGKWSSLSSAGVADLAVFFPQTAAQPDGTFASCTSPLGSARWVYGSASSPHALVMPAGAGMTVLRPQPAVVRVHYVNLTLNNLEASASISAELRPVGTAYSEAASYLSVNTQINLPPQQTTTVSGSCAVPAGAKFFSLTTRSRKYSVSTEVRDGTTVVLQSTDWQQPGSAPWADSPHHVFGGNLGYACTYQNTSNAPVTYGEDTHSETCEVIAYFFPATASRVCVNSTLLP